MNTDVLLEEYYSAIERDKPMVAELLKFKHPNLRAALFVKELSSLMKKGKPLVEALKR